MRTTLLTLILLILAGSTQSPSLYAEEPSKPLQAYQQARNGKDAKERLLFARETTGQSNDAEVVHEAVLDMVQYSTGEKDNQIALELIDSALKRVPETSDAYHETVLAKGKLLARMGDSEAAGQIFHSAIQKHWKNAMWRYSESFIENGFLDRACILEFERIAGLPEYRFYRGEDESLDIFLTLLRMRKHEKPERSATADVYEQIQSIPEGNPYHKLAKALCLAADSNARESVEILQELDGSLNRYRYRAKKNTRPLLQYENHREYRNIPLYIASILTKQGDSQFAANDAFSKFRIRNPGKNKKIIESAIRLARDMDLEQADRSKKDEFAAYINSSAWFKNPKVQSDIGEENIAVMYDQQQNGLAWSGEWEKSVEICKYVIERYPDTLGGQHFLSSYAVYLGWHDRDEAESVRLLNDILKNPKSDVLAVIARRIFAELAMKKGNYEEALNHVKDALRRLSPYEKGWKTEYRKQIEDLHASILKKVEGE